MASRHRGAATAASGPYVGQQIRNRSAASPVERVRVPMRAASISSSHPSASWKTAMPAAKTSFATGGWTQFCEK